jgi:hypothetical protein
MSSDPTPTSDSDPSHSPFYAVGSRWLNTSSGTGYICTDSTIGAAKWTRIGIQDIASITIGIAVIDATSQKIVANRAVIGNALPDPTLVNMQASPPVLMAQTWQGIIESGTFSQTLGLPPAAGSQVRVYQRQFNLR